MPNMKRAERMQSNVREDLLDTIMELNIARKLAKEAGNQELANQYLTKIGTVLDKLDELSDIALQQLNDSDEVANALKKLRAISGRLENKAREMKNTADKINTATKVVNQATKFISGLIALGAL